MYASNESAGYIVLHKIQFPRSIADFYNNSLSYSILEKPRVRGDNVVKADMEVFKEILSNVLELNAHSESVSSMSHARNPSTPSSRAQSHELQRPSRTGLK